MVSELNKLSEEEKALLLKAPLFISILAALLNDNLISETEKNAAEHLVHVRTYAAEPILKEYYKQVETDFEKNFEWIVSSLPTEIHAQREYLNEQISNIRLILPKLKKTTSEKLVKSLKGFLLHVFKSNTNAFAYLLLSGVINEIERTIQGNVRI